MVQCSWRSINSTRCRQVTTSPVEFETSCHADGEACSAWNVVPLDFFKISCVKMFNFYGIDEVQDPPGLQ